MLLRLLDNPGVIVLLTYVLNCYQRNRRQWQHVRTLIDLLEYILYLTTLTWGSFFQFLFLLHNVMQQVFQHTLHVL